jgi:hypothetical protein
MKTIKKIFHSITKKIVDVSLKKRSSSWPRVEKEFLGKNPVCAACGTNKSLNVHHKLPFHLFPENELDKSNLITLCMSKARMCHFYIGHGGSWRTYNPNVDENAKEVLEDPSCEKQIVLEAKLLRLKE